MKNLKITNFVSSELVNPNFVQPVRLHYMQNNKKKTWEAVKSHDSVAILLYHEKKDAFLFVKQFRAPVYMHHKEYTFTYELCAGIVDKEIPLIEIAKEEIDEECGFDVPIEKIEKITSFLTNVGISGAKQNLYFAKINDNMKIHDGGGIDDECIELEYVSIKESRKFTYDESKAKTPGLMFGLYWFYEKFKV